MKKMSVSTESKCLAEYSKKICVGSMIGILATALVLLCGAFMMSKVDFPQSGVPVISIFALVIGGFVAGFVVARLTRCNGLLYGLACGLLIFFVCVFCELSFMEGELGMLAVYKCAICVISGMIGGVLGVNKRKKSR